MKITIICVGKIKEKFYTEAVREYSKRLSRYCTLSITEVADEKTKEQQSTDGTLYCAGMIAGEGLVGILLAIFAVFGINTSIGESVNFGNIGGVILMVLMIASMFYFSLKKKKKA